ncbi:MAG: hypothetical protein GY717_17235 [Rhodobacteraceae bacterium]|nr:hypothetical protein [Paracoccaceae bacterium]
MQSLPRLLRLISALAAMALLTACAAGDADLSRPSKPMGDFRLGHNIVVARKPKIGPLSRTATEAEWQEVMTAAIDARFGGYTGEKLYHLGISVDGYVIAQAGIPVVASPKSILLLTVTVWDDAAGVKLNKEAKKITVLETLTGGSLIGTGLTQTKEQQMKNLAANAARAVQNWMLEHPDWFGVAQ